MGTFDTVDKQMKKKDKRIQALEDALQHLLEVQTAPSFPKGADEALYASQAAEWRNAVHDARAVLREKV